MENGTTIVAPEINRRQPASKRGRKSVKNEFRMHRDFAEIIVQRRGNDGTLEEVSAKIDLADVPLARSHKWLVFISNRGYRYLRVTGRGGIALHRLLMQPKPGKHIDHINHDTLDNRRANLREVSPSTNSLNRENVGAYFTGGKYQPQVVFRGIQIRLGSYEEKAHAVAAKLGALKLIEGLQRQNIIAI